MNTLSVVLNGLVILIAVMHIGFMVLEMFLWTKPIGLKIFRQSRENAQVSAKLAANQGLYNGFLAAGLIWGMITPFAAEAFHLIAFFLICVLVAGIYGGLTVSRRIWVIQALPAAICLAIMVFG